MLRHYDPTPPNKERIAKLELHERDDTPIKEDGGRPRCWQHRCFLINLQPREEIGQCPASGYWWSYRHLRSTRKIEKKKTMKLVNGELQEVEEDEPHV